MIIEQSINIDKNGTDWIVNYNYLTTKNFDFTLVWFEIHSLEVEKCNIFLVYEIASERNCNYENVVFIFGADIL